MKIGAMAVNGRTDAELIKLALEGRMQAFDELVERYHRALYGLAYRMLNNAEDAGDAVQETFLRAYRSLRDFRPDAPLKPWLFKICANICIDLGRKHSKAPESLDDHEYSLTDKRLGPDGLALNVERDEIIQAAVQKLPEQYRVVIVMRHFQDMEVEEIARALNAPEGTVKSWLFRARALLRKELTGYIKETEETSLEEMKS